MSKYILAAMVSLIAINAANATEKPTTPTTTNQNYNANQNLNGNANLNGNKNYNNNDNKNINGNSSSSYSNAAAEASSDQSSNNSADGGDTKVEAYAISYADAAPPTVPATVSNDVVVTTWGVKVLGPVFGMTDQHVHNQPTNVVKIADLVYTASTNDGTPASKARQHSTIVAMCADSDYRPALELRFGEGSCDDLNKVFKSIP